MERKYESPAFEFYSLEPGKCILVGSKTTVPIKIGDVKVHDYENGFDSEPEGFKEISFD